MLDICKKFIITFSALGIALLLTLLLLLDNLGSQYTLSEFQLTDLPLSAVNEKKERKDLPETCLLLTDSAQPDSTAFATHLDETLKILRVGFQTVDVAASSIPDFSDFQTVVISFQNLNRLGEKTLSLLNWVQDGGACLLFATPEITASFHYLSPYLGIAEGGTSYAFAQGMTLQNGFMLGGNGFSFHWGEPAVTTLNVRLADTATAYAVSDDERRMPLLWKAPCGQGLFVLHNIGFAEKTTRGFTAAAYGLLEETFIYPVINASTFFLDDFPSPVPMGDGTYIRRDYGRDISSFYSAVWWPDMLRLSDLYGIRYTGLLIENYTDSVDGVFPPQTDTERFLHFGATLLNHGGELGLHGYNHQPFCFPGFDFKGEVDYNHWPNEEMALSAVNEIYRFAGEHFPDCKLAVYVPPSNILSPEGRQFIRNKLPDIKVIASLYLKGKIEYGQEFELAEDGIVEFPRIISGAVLDTHMRWGALNALQLYYVNSHFMHPDDVLDEDRGAADGWEKLYGNLTDYADWLYTAAPSIRNLTGSDAGRATARFDCVSFTRTEDNSAIRLQLSGFWDEAYFMVRANGRTPVSVTGGSIEHISGDFYLLRATQDTVAIGLE